MRMERRHAPRPSGELIAAVHRLTAKQVDVFHEVQRHPEGVQVAEIGEALGMHPNTVRGHLDELMSAGVVSRHVATGSGRGRPSHVYTARVARTSSASRAIVALVEVLASKLPDDATATTAKAIGREWANRINARPESGTATDLDCAERQTAEMLREMGFDPLHRPDATTRKVRELGLNACPFITESGKRPAPVICALHEGFLEESLDGFKVQLRPHDRPGECGARLTKRP
ncbi:hypothetical protein HMPREF2617_01780 [Corynebacterium sp. HMSC070H05]|nr:hypothetical protein HMPREF2617_01780 [Corynebacterium sp. HMSC070H05]